MTPFRIAIGALALIALGACSNPDRFGGDGAGPNGGITDPDAYDSTGGLNDPSNPASPAYFSEAIGDRVLFEVDQSSLTPAAQGVLDRQATWLIDNPEYNAKIEGHADEQGTRVYNFNLGERRANAVREYLISRGVSANRITTISYGKERPIEICSEEACYQKNRRAVTVVTAGGVS
ncbi:peptidoglycan-associated lipoprotein Pal [Psychromarinibacter sp. C21-152]|uniref:Peptidoglycan-associated lipoprotein n=1 Tax=Psychromarinibacter sediminicola TaxID=3033385 RepID=A0AAE3T8T6_9RHOB|nr:peptidoglycan-associated lipoprotein Pal [Psychromarinibacter sediminicola]MDF0599845.1 peptidoglycan-associated lipoprotein Pal [Psychromarinibacter sediminicola]